MEKQTDTNQHDDSLFETSARSMGRVLDVVLGQYAIAWARIGTMQSSAGSLLTVMSIAIAVGFGSMPDKSPVQGLGCFTQGGFHLSFAMSILCFAFSAVCIIPILATKYIEGLPGPKKLREQTRQALRTVEGYGAAKNESFTEVYLIDRINFEVEQAEKLLKHNGLWYVLCYSAAFVSLASNLFFLLFCHIHIITENPVAKTLLAWTYYIVLVYGIILLFLYNMHNRTKET